MQDNANTKSQLVFPELSYQILGAAFRVFNEFGWGMPEKQYQLALIKEFEILKIPFKKEFYIPINYKSDRIGRYFADFLVDNKVLLELNVVKKLNYAHTRQVLSYLRNSNLKLGIILYFSIDGVKYRRVLNSAV